jgi:hypothetical protein
MIIGDCLLQLDLTNRFKLIMKNKGKILVFVIFLLFTYHKGFSQIGVVQTDTIKPGQKKTESSVNTKDKDTKTDFDKQKENDQNSPQSQSIKQVQGARPDMSKARGARPAYIERPVGSGIPKGIGRPGGAIKPGKK